MVQVWSRIMLCLQKWRRNLTAVCSSSQVNNDNTRRDLSVLEQLENPPNNAMVFDHQEEVQAASFVQREILREVKEEDKTFKKLRKTKKRRHSYKRKARKRRSRLVEKLLSLIDVEQPQDEELQPVESTPAPLERLPEQSCLDLLDSNESAGFKLFLKAFRYDNLHLSPPVLVAKARREYAVSKHKRAAILQECPGIQDLRKLWKLEGPKQISKK